jgi:peptidoglycan/xylan/chitin deacetylase (PgdA/CDA1 family)
MAGRVVLFFAGLLAAAGVARADLVTRLPTHERVVALTFDACQAGEPMAFDRGVLDYLVAEKIPFTVFASGRFVEANAADMQALAALDFVDIENHSWNHPNTMHRFSPEAVLDQVGRAHNEIMTVTGRTPQFFRFPAGNYNDAGLKAAESLGYHVVHWRWATGDPDRHMRADALMKRVAAHVQPGDILIFHINGRGVHTAEALPRIVEKLRADGYRFVLVSDYVGTPRVREPEPVLSIAAARHRLEAIVQRAPLTLLRAVP